LYTLRLHAYAASRFSPVNYRISDLTCLEQDGLDEFLQFDFTSILAFALTFTFILAVSFAAPIVSAVLSSSTI
jgi:hypothetical protein